MIQMTLSNDPQGRVSNDFHIIPAMEGESSRDEPTERTVATIVGGTAKRKGVTRGGVDTKIQGPVTEILGEEMKRCEPNQAKGSPTKNTEDPQGTPHLSPIPSSPGATLFPPSPFHPSPSTTGSSFGSDILGANGSVSYGRPSSPLSSRRARSLPMSVLDTPSPPWPSA